MDRRTFTAGALGLAACGVAPAVQAQAFAGKSITVVFNFATGGSGDGSARLVADKLRQSLGASVIVDNKTGAAGRIGVAAVKNAKPDGLTLLYTPFGAMTLYPHSYKDLGYDPAKDFVPVGIAGSFEFALVVNAETPVKTMAELVDWLKKNPDKTSYGSPGAGTLPHFMGVSLAKAIGLPLGHATYRGSAAAINDLIGGHVPFVITTLSDILTQHKAGKLRIIATSDAKRSPFVPDVPTFREAGFPLEGVGWYAFYAPAGTPAALIADLSKAVRDAVTSPDVRDKFLAMGLVPVGSTSAELAARQAADSAQWAPVIKASGFTPEQ